MTVIIPAILKSWGFLVNLLDIAAQFIPGYQTLPENLRLTFEGTTEGQKFVKAVSDAEKAIAAFMDSSTWWSRIFGSDESKREQLQSQLKSIKEDCIKIIQNSANYSKLTREIYLIALETVWSDLEWLNEEQRYELAEMPFSQKLRDIVVLNQQINELSQAFHPAEFSLWQYKQQMDSHQEKLFPLLNQREKILSEWQQEFTSTDQTQPLREVIRTQKRSKQNEAIQQQKMAYEQQLDRVEGFDWLNTARKERLIEDCMKQLSKDEDDKDFIKNNEFPALLSQKLAEHFAVYLQQFTNQYFDYLRLEDFNIAQAHRLIKQMVDTVGKKQKLNLEAWLQNYQNECSYEIKKNVLLINNKPWTIKHSEQQYLLGAISSLFLQNKTVEKTKEFFDKLADAHAFIQATGFSTQNESSFLAIIDLYNYGRTADQIIETKTILLSLLQPFAPLYAEYRDIALYEKNVYSKLLRTVMPMLIATAFVVLISVLFAPLIVSELVFTIVLIPTLFLGLALATKYVALKDSAYKSLREIYYGGAFEIPEYQINQRMLCAFKNKENALAVRDFYVEEIKKCEEIETSLQAGHEAGLLNQEAIKARKENQLRRHTLCLEWYDIHSNTSLGWEKTADLVLARLTEVSSREYHCLQKGLDEDSPKLLEILLAMILDLKQSLIPEISNDSVEEKRDFFSVKRTTDNYSPSLFKPIQLIEHKKQTEKLDQITSNIKLCMN